MYTEKKSEGVRIAAVHRDTPAYSAGLRQHDRIVSINGERVSDNLDFSFHTASETLEITAIRRGSPRTFLTVRKPGTFLGIDPESPPVARCSNRCLFCFIDQLPHGLRKSLYVKDEDLRHSFLNGNYVTLTSLAERDLDRIGRLGLSPLYISVHATDPVVRIALLKNRFAGRIMYQLRQLELRGISFHAQIVVCPGINDGIVLKKTLRDLCSFSKGLLSVAVVPVGLTAHRSHPLEPFTKATAQETVELTEREAERDSGKTGFRRVFIADELFIKAGRPIPRSSYYGDFPQRENGVGLIRLLLDEWRQVRKEMIAVRGRGLGSVDSWCVVTSVSAKAFIDKIVHELAGFYPGVSVEVLPVVNFFFGTSVTVAGLLAARDILTAVKNRGKTFHAVILPDVIFNYRGFTLDGYSRKRIEKLAGMPVFAAANMQEIVTLITGRKI